MIPASVFVYGTLQRGECRADQWPHPPLSVENARVRGMLFDLGPYPAMTAGDDWVGGERWQLGPEHILPTLKVLDAIEGYSASADDLYVRRVVSCWAASGSCESAFAYFYARPDQLQRTAERIRPDSTGHCVWNRAAHPRGWPQRPP